jgi:UDPglucose--hexose-1-phosphate uridylyltransferase
VPIGEDTRAVELRRERLVAEFLDPRSGFERSRVPLEIRWDPLTGQSCRLLPDGSFPPPAQHDLEVLARETRETCPFCGSRVEHETPRFPPEIWPDGRIRRGDALLFPNLVPYAKWSSVSIYSPERHLLPLGELGPSLIADNLATQVDFARAVTAHDPSSDWISVNANHLPPSGSSIFHPHLQGSANPEPTTMQRLLAAVDPTTVCDYVEGERERGERFIASVEGVDWLTAFAPLGPAEVRAFVFGSVSPADLDGRLVATLARGVSATLGVYDGLGFESFNLAIYGAPAATRGYALNLRLVARAYYGPARRSDAMWSERMHWEAATDLAPERVAGLARSAFAEGST